MLWEADRIISRGLSLSDFHGNQAINSSICQNHWPMVGDMVPPMLVGWLREFYILRSYYSFHETLLGQKMLFMLKCYKSLSILSVLTHLGMLWVIVLSLIQWETKIICGKHITKWVYKNLVKLLIYKTKVV